MNRRFFATVLPALLLSVAATALWPSSSFAAGANAAAYPTRMIRLVVPFPPGGGNDSVARYIARQLSIALKQSVIVDNRGGAGGVIGVEYGLNAPPDGYTLTMISSSYAVNPSLYRLRFDPLKDFTPIIIISRGALVLVANPGLPAKSVKDLIALAKSKPGKINYASSGQGSIGHLSGVLFGSEAGVDMTHIPYQGGGPALTDTVAGQTNLFFSTVAQAGPLVKAGNLRALGVTTSQRVAALPDVPTIAEAGVPGYDVTLWHALIGPKNMPPDIVDRLNRAMAKILALPQSPQQLAADGMVPAGGTPAQLQALVQKDVGTWRQVAAQANIRPQQ